MRLADAARRRERSRGIARCVAREEAKKQQTTKTSSQEDFRSSALFRLPHSLARRLSLALAPCCAPPLVACSIENLCSFGVSRVIRVT